MTPISLSQNNLAALQSRLPVPTYDRTSATSTIAHIGVGGFHRAHLAYYLHALSSKAGAASWAICGIGIREGDRQIHDALAQQDHLYTLIVKHPDGTVAPEVIGSIVDFKLGTDRPDDVVDRLAAADTKIVSLTITEGGYNFHPATGEFDFGNPDVQHELRHPGDPKTVYGFLTAALRQRRAGGLPAFTVLSCDNIEHNGDVAREMLLVFAKAQDPDLAEWIEQEVRFPNSMVDRITPATTPADIALLAQDYGLADAWPVTCEPFLQWVVEDKFSDGRPAFEKVNVHFVSDVGPYEKMKLRLLNAGHSVLGLLGVLHGHATINACVEDPVFERFLRAFLDEEATPILGDVAGIDLAAYKDTLLERFANPNIRDSVGRICMESSAKLPKFLIPTLSENLARGGSIRYATLVIAAWCYVCDKGVDKNGQRIEIVDAASAELHAAARQTETDPLAFVKQEWLFGELALSQEFANAYTKAVRQVYAGTDVRRMMEEMV